MQLSTTVISTVPQLQLQGSILGTPIIFDVYGGGNNTGHAEGNLGWLKLGVTLNPYVKLNDAVTFQWEGHPADMKIKTFRIER